MAFMDISIVYDSVLFGGAGYGTQSDSGVEIGKNV